ncbi:MAG: hypothetical protein GY832_03050 [Chloroflexi bacterium]|nr:hypothetical protein [Chloroflexota bacterium]
MNGQPTMNGATPQDFYIITRFPETAGSVDKRYVGIELELYEVNFRTKMFKAEWYPDKDVGGTSTVLMATPSVGVDDYDYTTVPELKWTWGNENTYVVPVGSGTDDGFKCAKFEITYGLVARLSTYGVPISETLPLDQAVVPAANIAVNETLRGYDSDAGTSIGAIAHMIDSGDSVIHNTSRCLFQTTYPMGMKLNNLALTDFREDSINNNPTTLKVVPRNLDGGTDKIEAEIALVMTCDAAGEVVKYSSGADTWTFTSSGAMVAQLVTTSDGVGGSLGAGRGLEIDVTADYIQIEGNTNGNHDLIVHTASLWEPASGR